MKNHLLLASILFLASCGQYKVTTNNKLGEVRVFKSEAVGVEVLQNVQTLCNALTEKASLLGVGVAQTFTFTVSQKSCEETSMSDGKSVDVYTEISGSSYNFKRSDNSSLFIYPDIETHQSGITKELCSRLSSLSNPIKLSNGNAIWFEVSRNAMTDCAASSTDLCLMVETGLPKDGKYTVITRDVLKFQLDRNLPKFGFFSTRKSYSNAFCTGSNYSETSAVLSR